MRKRDETIRPGDLVMVVRPRLCCGNTEGIGKIYVAQDVGKRLLVCGSCKSRGWEIIATFNSTATFGALPSRLKKIHPPSIDDAVERTEELTV